MPLIKVEALNYDASYAYAPSAETCWVNTDDVQSIRPAEARGAGPFFKIRFRDGHEITCRGSIEDVERLIAGVEK